MGSRLFHTLVGVGISLGATGTGCGGQSTDAAESVTRGTTVGSGGSDFGGGSGAPGTAAQGGDGSDPFCDTTWPTTKGDPPIPECVDPDHECQDEFALRCLIPVGEFACDGGFERSYAPFCVDGSWECEAGLVPVTECKCLAPLAEGQICTEDGISLEEDP